jgi:hypothetical protein
MSRYETLSILVSLLAAGIAAYALVRSHKLAKRQTALQEEQTKLATLQHKLLVRDQQARARADIRAGLVQIDSSYKLEVRNAGAAPARNLRLSGLDGPELDQILAGWNASEIFPMTELLPDEVVSVRAPIYLGTKFPITIIVTWDDDAGDDRQRELKVAL